MSILDRLGALVPGWMLDVARQHYTQLMAGPGLMLDAMTEVVIEGRLAAMPGQKIGPGIIEAGGFDSFDALPLIARDRLVCQGLTETPFQLAARLRTYEDDWTHAGTAFGLLDELARALGPSPPLMRIVTSGGAWYTREQDGTYLYQTVAGTGFSLDAQGNATHDTTVAHAWYWDGITLPAPPDKSDFSRAWLILYPPVSVPYLTTTDGTAMDPGRAGDLWNDPTADVEVIGQPSIVNPWAGTCGSNAPLCLVELIRSVIQQRGCAGFRMAWIVVAFDATQFAPDGSSTLPGGVAGTAYPDGLWGWHTKYDSGTNSQIVARNATAEYWPGTPGGILPYTG